MPHKQTELAPTDQDLPTELVSHADNNFKDAKTTTRPQLELGIHHNSSETTIFGSRWNKG